MSVSELYTKDTRVWIPDPDKVWKAGRLLKNYDQSCTTLEILTDDDQLRIEYDVDSNSLPNLKLPPLRNPDILIGQNDLTALSYLNEPEVLYNLEVRFLNNNQIYTYCGIVLVAINPYEQLDIYGNEIIQAYNSGDVQNMDPHIFAVSEEAFQEMVKFDHNQSIIVSGESGAGKTVSAKYTMRYFANVGGSSEETQVEKKVLASNPVMEAFGNAKTTRNDNSSRFGKFIQIDFNKSHHIVGGSMKTYLLEKSRVVFQAIHERNYHIFYQLCSQYDKKEYAYLNLLPASDFYYTNQGNAEEIPNVNDSDVFNETLDAFRMLEIKKSDQQTIFSLLSAIMHLGNVRIVNEKPNESSSVDLNDQSIQIFCHLLGIDESRMRTWLCNKRIKTVNEVVNTPLPLSQALFSRDALAKHMYSQLFNWIVQQVNKCLISPVKTHSFIGVLDIYGFETFEINSFEQFCINYANEKLQQQFCQHVFKLEQEEYMREQIKWSFIEFYDNQPCIELIEGKIGILDLLDEECKMPKGSDLTWCNKLYDKHLKPIGSTSHNHFSKPRMSSKAFLIHHFAEKVEYQVDGFLEKNRDTVLEEQLKVLKTSDIDFIAELFLEETDEKQKGYEVKRHQTLMTSNKTQVSRKKTVGSQFRESLSHLMIALNSTTPHYVRCIKPNDFKSPFKFQAKRAVEQLRACGVLETVRISAAGYPSRWTYQEFFQRYRMLINSKLINRKAFKETCEHIIVNLIKDQSKYQFGKTKIFFQAGQVAYLEKLRSEKLKSCGIIIQKHIRGWLARSKYVKIKRSILLIQSNARGCLARRLVKHKRETRAAIIIQSMWRCYNAKKNYKKHIKYIISLQSLCRGYLARKDRLLRILNIKATVIQAHIRGWLERKNYSKIKKGIIQLQAHVRRRQARKIFKTLKLEARSVEHQRKLNKGLENKIISLQQHIEKINKEREHLLSKTIEIESLKTHVNNLKHFSNIAKESQSKINDLNEELISLRSENEKIKKERESFLKSKDSLEKNLKESTQSSTSEISQLRFNLNEANEKINTSQKKIDEMKKQLNEIENERANHQKLIKEHSKLEQRFEKVRNELLKLSKSNYHAANNSSSVTSTTSITTQVNSDLESLIEELEQEKLIEPLHIRLSSSNTSTLSNDTQNNLNNFESNKLLYMTANGSEMDVSLISRLNRRISLLQMGNSINVNNEHDNNNNADGQSEHSLSIERLHQEKDYELIKSQELELENQKLREDLNRLRDLVEENQSMEKDSLINKEMMDQFDALNEEVKRRREECIQLKSLLVNVHRASRPLLENSIDMNGETDLNSVVSNLNYEGNESELRYNSQKILNRVLENQMNDMKKKHEQEKKIIQKEMYKLIEENDRQYGILMNNLTPEKLVEETYKNEIIKLAENNLELSEKNDRCNEEIKKYKKMLKIYIKRSKTMNIQVERYNPLNSLSTVSLYGANCCLNASDINNKSISLTNNSNLSTLTLTNVTQHHCLKQNNLTNSSQLTNNSISIYVPHIKSKDSIEYSGYFEWKPDDEAKIISKLIDDLKPRLAVTFLPGLPAYVLFMCIRYADLLNDDERVKSLLGSSVHAIKRLIKRKQEDLEYVVLWVTNLCRLIHNLKQYSGDSAFQTQNTSKQNEQCLKNFDLTEYRGILSDIAIWLFQGIIKEFENKLNLIIVPAMLEQESLMHGQNIAKLSGARANDALDHRTNEKYTIDSLLKKLNEFLSILKSHGVDPEIMNQIFRQLFYFIGANTFNNLILRKEMCNWSKGINIRYNISQLEQWLRDSRLQDSGALETLETVIQASQLLQARKSESDIKSICDMCSKLTIAQVQRILFMYTPLESYEEKLNRTFINKVVEKLKEIRRTELNETQNVLTLDTKKPFSVYIPFNPSNISLETIEIPDQLGLGFLKKS